MRKLSCLLVAVALSGCFATVGPDGRAVGGEVSFSLGLPVILPPLVVIQPGVSVVSDLDQEVFFADGYYWARQISPGTDPTTTAATGLGSRTATSLPPSRALRQASTGVTRGTRTIRANGGLRSTSTVAVTTTGRAPVRARQRHRRARSGSSWSFENVRT